MRLKYFLYIIIIVLFADVNADAGVLSVYNHPEIKWNYLKSGDFTVYYPNGDSVEAQRVLNILIPFEDTADCILGAPKGHTDVVLNNYDDISNGMANSVGDIINIYTHPYYTVTTGNIGWLRRVARHEFSHIATYKALTPLNWTPLRLLTMATIPQWFYEGIAQYCAETMDDNRKMFIREGIKNRTMLNFNFLDQTAVNDMIDGRDYYEEGHGIVQMRMKEDSAYLRDILKLQSVLGLFFPFHLNYLIASGRFAYDDFTKWMETERMKVDGDTVISFKKMRTPFKYMKGFKERGNVRVYCGFNDLDIPENSLVYLRNGKKVLIDKNVGAFFDLSPNDEKIVYSKMMQNGNGTLNEGIVLYDIRSNKRIYLTHNAKTTNPVFYNDSTVIYTKFAGTRGELIKYDLKNGKSDVFIKPRNNFEYFVTPSCSRHYISYERIGKTRCIVIADSDGETIDSIYSPYGESRQPYMANDSTLYFTGYFSGRPEIYRYDLKEKKYYRETKAFSGHFQPFVVNDTLCFIDYHGRKGFSLEFRCKTDSFYDVRYKKNMSNVSLPPYKKVTDISTGRYNPFGSFKLVGVVPLALPDYYASTDGDSVYWNPRFIVAGLVEDPLLKNVMYGFIGSNIFSPTPMVYVNYINSIFYPTFNLSYLRYPYIVGYTPAGNRFFYHLEERGHFALDFPFVLSRNTDSYSGLGLSFDFARTDTLFTAYYDAHIYTGRGRRTYNDDVLDKDNILIYADEKLANKKILCPDDFSLASIRFSLNKPMNSRVVNHILYSIYYATGAIKRTSIFIDKRNYGGFPDYDIPQRFEIGTDFIAGRNIGKNLLLITLPYIRQISFGMFSDNYGFYKISNRDFKFRSFLGIRSNIKLSYYYFKLILECGYYYDVTNRKTGTFITLSSGVNGL